MSRYIHQSHNVSVLLYHAVFPTKYRRVVIDERVDLELRAISLEIAQRYEIEFIEIGCDDNHVHFLVQSVPSYSPTTIVRIIKSITAREVFERVPQVKKQLWGGSFWSSGYFINTVGHHGSEDMIRSYVVKQGNAGVYKRIHRQQLSLF